MVALSGGCHVVMQSCGLGTDAIAVQETFGGDPTRPDTCAYTAQGLGVHDFSGARELKCGVSTPREAGGAVIEARP